MNPLSILFILFLAIPLLEIYLLIEVGGMIGAFPTVFMVVFTAVLGAWLLRIQGFATLNRVRRTVADGGIPAIELLEAAVLLVSGALLLTPGFFTDAIGFICLVPSFRRTMIRWTIGRFLTPMDGSGGGFGGSFGGKSSGSGTERNTFSKNTTSSSNSSSGSSTGSSSGSSKTGSNAGGNPSGPQKPRTIEGEFHRED